jgi:hypothetical protein
MIAGLARIAAQRASWYGRMAAGRARIAAAHAAASAGLPVMRRRLLVDCPDGEEGSGLFSEVAAVVGCLDHYERHARLYAGLRVDFADHGLYYEDSAGPNWWTYYFEPLEIGEAAPEWPVPDWLHDGCAEAVELTMPRERAAALLRQHVRVRGPLERDVDRYWREQVGACGAIGVHYRGTDKWEGAPVVPLDRVASAVGAALDAAGPAATRVFLATDEQACLDYLRARFPDRLLALDLPRSTDGSPLHKRPGHGFQKGYDAMMDCLLLARCARLVRTDSDLGLFASFFNPGLPVTLLSTTP